MLSRPANDNDPLWLIPAAFAVTILWLGAAVALIWWLMS